LNRMEYTIAEFLEIVAAEFEPVPVGIQQNEVKHVHEIVFFLNLIEHSHIVYKLRNPK
jgi:hypothetical protein